MNDTNPEKQSMKRWLRFICGLLGSIVLLSLIALAFRGYQTGAVHAAWYHATGSGDALCEAVCRGIHSGDPVSRLDSFVGRPTVISAADEATAVLMMQELIATQPQMCPDGLQTGDTFVGYELRCKTGPKLMLMQVRNGQLVNWDAPFKIILDK